MDKRDYVALKAQVDAVYDEWANCRDPMQKHYLESIWVALYKENSAKYPNIDVESPAELAAWIAFITDAVHRAAARFDLSMEGAITRTFHDALSTAIALRVRDAALPELPGVTSMDPIVGLQLIRDWGSRRSISEAKALRSAPSEDGTVPGRSRRRRAVKPKSLTARQSQALDLYGQHKGNMAAAARAMGVAQATFEDHYRAAAKKIGHVPVRHLTRSLPVDQRGQASVSRDRRKDD